MVAVIFQEDVSDKARKSMAKEKVGGKCEFDKSLEGMRLKKTFCIKINSVATRKFKM